MIIKLIPLNEQDKDLFIKSNQEAFQKGYEAYFGKCSQTIIPREDILESLNHKNAHSFFAYGDGEIVGGVAVSVNEETNINQLEILFVKVGVQSKGIGFAIWSDIEKLFPKTKVWKTCTPYFDQRNIHFYLNKCKFHIVEFTNKYHKDPKEKEGFIGDGGEGMFEFEKIMKH